MSGSHEQPAMPVSRLLSPVDPTHDHIRGGGAARVVNLVLYGDYLCPYCRRLRFVIAGVRKAQGDRLAYVFRHFPNERAHPGADFASRAAEAAANQDRFWDMHDKLFAAEPPISTADVTAIARDMGLDMERFARDVDSEGARTRVAQDIMTGRSNGVTGTPTFFIDNIRYDGAWDFYSMLEAARKPVAERIQRSARVFANLPASGGLVLILAAALALLCANSPLAPYYKAFVSAPFGIGLQGSPLSMTVGDWFSQGLLAFFLLIVGLEIRREMAGGALSDVRAAVLPAICAVGGGIAPALIYLALNPGATAPGWSVPTATDIAFALGVLALLGDRVPIALRVFVAALAVFDDVLSILTLAIFYPHDVQAIWFVFSALASLALLALNRSRVYASWPYLIVGVGLWISLHSAGVHAALAGIVLALFLPSRPSPAAAPLLAQAATALAALEYAETDIRESANPERSIEQEPIWDWASRNLSAASDRLLSPADRFEQALAPWTGYLILPLFAFSATGVGLQADISQSGAGNVILGVILGLLLGKPIGICVAAALAIWSGLARVARDISIGQFIGAACLCGIGDTVALLMADQAFPNGNFADFAKIGVLVGSVLAALLGAIVIIVSPARNAEMKAKS